MISCLLLNVHAIENDACHGSAASFSLSTLRNNTGHWHSEVKMDVPADAEKVMTSPRNLDVSVNNKRCDGKETFSIVTAVTVRAPKAGPGYELFADIGYYKFHTTKQTWSDAKTTCVSEGGHLAILNSDAEANVVKQLFSQNKVGDKWAFIGFHDKSKEGVYITIFDEPLEKAGYTKWGSGQPDNAGDEDCGSVDHDGKLNDYPCSFKAPFICEYELY